MLRSKSLLKSCFFLFLLTNFVTHNLYTMAEAEVVLGDAARAAEVDIGALGETATRELAEQSLAKLGFQEVETLSPSMRQALKDEMVTTLKSMKSAGIKFEPANIDSVRAAFSKTFNEGNSFYNNIAKNWDSISAGGLDKGITIEEFDAIKTKSPTTLTEPQDFVATSEIKGSGVRKPEGAVAADTQRENLMHETNIANDKWRVAFKKNGFNLDDPAVIQASKEFDTAVGKAAEYENNMLTKVAADSEKQVVADTNNVAKGSEENVKPEDTAKADANTEKTNAEAKAVERGGERRLKMMQAKDELKAAEKDLTDKEALQKTGKATQKDVDVAREKVENAKKAYSDAKNDFEQNDSTWSGFFKRHGKATLFFLGKDLLWEILLKNILSGFAFALPNVVMEGVRTYNDNQRLRETLHTSNEFGNIWMEVPEDFINDDEPLGSKFVYVGLNPRDVALDQSYLQNTAHYFVAKSDYQPWATVGITDPNFSNIMVDLNTGYVFVKDGNPYDENNPGMQLLATQQDAAKRPPVVAIETHINALSSAGSNISANTPNMVYFSKSTKIKGNDTIDNLFKKPDVNTPPALLLPAIETLDNGTTFAGKYNIEGLTALTLEQLQLLGNCPPDNLPLCGPVLAAPYVTVKGSKTIHGGFVAQGYIIYQTQDTPFIQGARNQLDDPDPTRKNAKQNTLYDYVVFSDENTLVPCMIPAGAKTMLNPDGAFPGFVLNPNAKYMISLLDNTVIANDGTVYPSDIAKKSFAQMLSIMGSQLTGPAGFDRQFNVMRNFVSAYVANGPFIFGSHQLTIDPAYAKAGVPVYKISGKGNTFLEDGSDDYVVALVSAPLATDPSKVVLMPTQLPSANPIVYFVSLVTSRFYDANLSFYNKPTQWWVVSAGQQRFSLKLQPPSTSLYNGTSPLYSLFMDADINPNNPTTVPSGAPQTLPITPQWALNWVKVDGTTSMPDYLNSKAPDLLKNINASYSAWKPVYETGKDIIITKEALIGPFIFATNASGTNINLNATSYADVVRGNFVYSSPYYKDEYLVLSSVQTLDSPSIGSPFDQENADNRQYAFSLSNGNVYTALGDSSHQPGDVVDTVDINALYQKAQRVPFVDPLKTNIINSQTSYKLNLRDKLIKSFGRFVLYIDAQSYMNKQYIYADVTKFSPLDAQGKQIADFYDKVTDFFVAGKTITNTDGTKLFAWGYPLDQAEKIVSLVSGAIYLPGAYGGQYEKYVDKDGKVESGYVNLLLQSVYAYSKKSTLANPALQTKIDALFNLQKADVEAAQQEMQKAKQKREQADILPLSIKSALDDDVNNPYLAYGSPRIANRFVKNVAGKYYLVNPPFTIDTTISIPRNYVALSLDSDPNKGMVYDKDGNAILELVDWGLRVARAFAGVSVAPDGTQKRIIGVDYPTIPMTYKNQSALIEHPEFALADPYSSSTSYKFYYNYLIDSWFVQILKNNTPAYYIHLSSGVMYNLDGSPRLDALQLYKEESTGDILLIGKDMEGCLVVDFRGNNLLYATYNQVTPADQVSYIMPDNTVGDRYPGLMGTSNYPANLLGNDVSISGKQYTLFNEPTQIEVGEVKQNADGTNIARNDWYYLIWDADTKQMLGTYKPDQTQQISLLLYIQTRQAGSGSTGEFDPKNYQESDDKGLMNPIAIVMDVNGNWKQIFYKKQLCALTTADNQVFTAQYLWFDDQGTSKMFPITIKKENIPNLFAQWLSITDGSNIYDYQYDVRTIPLRYPDLAANPNIASLPYVDIYHPGEGVNQPTTLAQYKLNRWGGIEVTTFVPNFLVESADPNFQQTGIWRTMLVTTLIGLKSVDNTDVQDYEKLDPAIQTVIDNATAKLYKTTDKLGNTIYLYQLGMPRSSSDTCAGISGGDANNPYGYTVDQYCQNGQVVSDYYQSSMGNGYVNIANGVLYDAKNNPIGASLAPDQLYALLDNLQLSAIFIPAQLIDDPNNPGQKKPAPGTTFTSKLAYRTASTIQQESGASAATPPVPGPHKIQARPAVHKKVKPLGAPIKKIKKPAGAKPPAINKVQPTMAPLQFESTAIMPLKPQQAQPPQKVTPVKSQPTTPAAQQQTTSAQKITPAQTPKTFLPVQQKKTNNKSLSNNRRLKKSEKIAV